MLQVTSVKTLVLLVGMLFSQTLLANNWRMVLDLSGDWRFSIGDNIQWANPDFNDRQWETIRAPAPWES